MKKNLFLALSSILLISSSLDAFAAPLVNPSTTPLETGVASLVKPNLMFIFDDSASMARDYLGDEVGNYMCKTVTPATPPSIAVTNWQPAHPQTMYTTLAACNSHKPPNGTHVGEYQYYCGRDVVTYGQCLSMGDNGCTSWSNPVYTDYFVMKGRLEAVSGTPETTRPFTNACRVGYVPEMWMSQGIYAPDVPHAAYSINKMYYNPNTIYKAGVDYTGASLGNQSLSSARMSIYQNNESMNILTKSKEIYYCTTPNPTASQFSDTNYCKRNGIDTPNPFNYNSDALPKGPYYYSVLGPSPIPFYYDVIPTEYCDASGINCSATQSTTYPNPMPIRWCSNIANANNTSVVTGAGKCQKNYGAGYAHPRFGNFKRVNLPPEQYGNYANWFTYYRTRMLASLTASGLAFSQMDDSKRIGLISLNSPTSFLPVGDFSTVGGTSSQKAKFFNKLYGLTANGDTDLKKSLSIVGRYYAGISSGISSGMINGTTSKDPVQYSCQQNFSLIATDGYWNPGTNGTDLNSNTIGNQDNVNSSANYSLRSDGVYDGGLTGASGTLSDVALYYYKTNLRSTSLGNCSSSSSGSAQDLCQSNVPVTAQDQNPNQHMVTYAMSLGLSGLMSYTKDYMNGTSTDLQNIKNGANGACSWTTGVCNWPVPMGNDNAALDDLWHATISGRGRYFSAQDSADIITGLQDALNAVSSQTGSSAAAATSSPNITSSDNSLFYVTYRTAKWDGEITATTIDPNTGVISPTKSWSARTQLNSKVSSNSDTRNIYYVRNDGSGNSVLRGFQQSNMNTSEMANFKNKCSSGALSQCSSLSSTNKSTIDTGSELIKYLRGQSEYDVNNSASPLFRAREFVLGDIVNSSPVYISKPLYNWTDTGYSTFVTNNASRDPTLYVGANDGMIHAFDAATGNEKWAIIPAQMMSKLYKLADTSYSTGHEFFVDGSISIMDAQIGGSWKTILITGMSRGGKGYVALDITNPNSPSVLWEACNSSECLVSDSEFGYSYGNPIISKRAFDGKWVAYLPAGYDNSTGKGLIYEVDIANGSILRKLYTGTGSSTNQSGIARINAYYANFKQDNTALYIYAGDLDGKIWRWDLSDSSNTTATQLGQATDPSNNPQPITTKIELGKIDNNIILFVGTGKFLNTTDYTTTQIQSVYAIKDTNTNLGSLRGNSGMIQQVVTPGGLTSTVTNNAVDFSTNNGWYFDLISQTGERVNVDPSLALGVLNLVSNVPGTSSCTAGGNAWMYQIDFAKGTAIDPSNAFIAKKMNTGLIVGQVIVQLGTNGGLKNYLTDAGGQVLPITVPTKKGGPTPANLRKHFWKEVIVN